MKRQHISPLVRIGLTAASILALWLGIEEYVEVKSMTQDCILAILKMVYMFVLVYGSSYILYVGGICLYPMLKTAGRNTSKAITPEQFNEMVLEESKKSTENHDILMESLLSYTSYTFRQKLSTDQLNILLENIRLLSDGKDADESVTQRMKGVTSNDLYHFGWNVGKRLKRSNIQIAYFLKGTFKAMLEDVSIDTVQTKLAIKEGNFTLKLVPLDQELIPHIFPERA